MVDITEISAMVAAAGVLIGVIYYILEIRHQTRTRETELVTNLASVFAGKEFQRDMQEVIQASRSGAAYSEMEKRIGMTYPQTGYFFEELGILLHRKLVDISLVDDLFSGPIIRFWEASKPYVEEARKRLNEPQYAEWFEYLYDEMKKREQKLQQ
jgi:hypothetical protein